MSDPLGIDLEGAPDLGRPAGLAGVDRDPQPGVARGLECSGVHEGIGERRLGAGKIPARKPLILEVRGGTCQVSCGGGLTNCSGICRDLDNDRLDCAMCGHTCGPGELCAGGTCGVSCTPGLTDCGGVCRDLTTDVLDCGTCGTVCLGGGCFFNAVLTRLLTRELAARRLHVLQPLRHSCGDAGLALGQAWAAAMQCRTHAV
jgi:hypothetical protein